MRSFDKNYQPKVNNFSWHLPCQAGAGVLAQSSSTALRFAISGGQCQPAINWKAKEERWLSNIG
jgi:hypothetical protein